MMSFLKSWYVQNKKLWYSSALDGDVRKNCVYKKWQLQMTLNLISSIRLSGSDLMGIGGLFVPIGKLPLHQPRKWLLKLQTMKTIMMLSPPIAPEVIAAWKIFQWETAPGVWKRTVVRMFEIQILVKFENRKICNSSFELSSLQMWCQWGEGCRWNVWNH